MRFVFFKMRISRALLMGVLCVTLVLLSGMVQAAHFHASAQPDHDCALCLTMHSVAQATAPIVLHFSSRSVASVVLARAISRPRAAVHFRLASRPPPAATSLFA
ncbi:MAG: hypothetical protein WA414_06535 [Acidobacteriaceae bacterium]